MSTLFSYFSKVGSKRPCPSAGESVNENVSCKKDCGETTPKSSKIAIKKRRYRIDSDESDDGGNFGGIDGEDGGPNSEGETENGCAHAEESIATPKGAKLCNKKVEASTSANITPPRKKSAGGEVFLHDQLKWLQKEHCRDKNGRQVTHVDYDPKTLQVPREYCSKLTPGFQQWWTIKADHFDSVIMFKVGKFYELYHMDAVIGVRELGLVFMKADFAHCGFPEAGFGRYSDSLVQKGYKVVRVEQVETPAMMEQRIKKMGGAKKSDRVVRREVCSITTRGTRTLNFFTGDSGHESVFLLAVKEQPIAEAIHNKIYGVCFVDTRVGNFYLGQFRDDAESSRLRTLLAHYPPGHVLYERHGLLPQTNRLIKILLSSALKDALVPGEEFWGAGKTMQALAEGNYFETSDTGGVQWPHALKAMFSDVVGFGVATEFELAASALGACVWCLKRAHLEYSLLTLANFRRYDPLDLAETSLKNPGDVKFTSQRLILDDITLANLDIISPDSQTGTLLEKLDTTVTAFGKRLLRQWVCAPLASISGIGARQDAIEQLMSHPSLMAQAKGLMCKLPDLERLLRKIHSQGCFTHSKDHPDARAILFEHVTYSKRKIADFISVLEGFSLALKIVDLFQQVLEGNEKSLLSELLSREEGRFPDLEKQLTFYGNSFDKVKAKEEGVIVPNHGVNRGYDSAQEVVSSVLKELESYLAQQKQRLKCKSMTYWGNGRNRFQIEIPISAISNLNLGDYELTSQRKGVRRYRTAAIELMLKKLMEAEEKRDQCLRDTMESLFHSFDQHFSMWEEAVQCLANLDVLISLATYSLSASDQMTRPILLEPCTPAILEIRDGCHPSIIHTHNGGEYIPNDVSIESQHSCLLVTGPNMGGKSTLMRQTGLLVVLAQMGCSVPATKCRLSPVDRIFTRMGACDRIMARESTFFVELKETCSILQHATCHSLVLVDELGRGTATYDGAAIASAVVEQLSQVLQCRTLFSTHYHFLVDQFVGNPSVQLGHMACLVEEEGGEEAITFLYKFTEGACPKSYGFNVAQLASLPSSVITLARRKATTCEQEAQHVRLLRKILQPNMKSRDLKILLSTQNSTWC